MDKMAETNRAAAKAAKKDDRDDRLYVKSVGKAFQILEAFADSAGALSLAQLAEAADLDKSSAQRLAHTLQKLGYVERVPTGLRPGRRVLERSFDYLRGHPLVSRALPILSDLRRTTQERVDLSLFDDTSMLYLVRLQSKSDSFYAHLNGRRVPTYCTAGGRSVLAKLAEDRVSDILDRSKFEKITPKTTVDRKLSLRYVKEARENGYAISQDEILVGELACGVAILDEDGSPVAAIHVAGSRADWTPEEFERRVAPLAVQAGRAISF